MFTHVAKEFREQILCELCDSTFTRSESLKNHMKTEHETPVMLQCFCGKQFNLKVSLILKPSGCWHFPFLSTSSTLTSSEPTTMSAIMSVQSRHARSDFSRRKSWKCTLWRPIRPAMSTRLPFTVRFVGSNTRVQRASAHTRNTIRNRSFDAHLRTARRALSHDCC